MKIAYLMQVGVPDVRQHPLSGPANHVKHVFNELIGLGHQVRLLAYMNGQIWQSDNLIDFERVSLRWLDNGLFRLFESIVRRLQSGLHLPYAALFESLYFAQACRQVLSGFDIFYERMGWVGYGGVLAARRLKIPLILEVNGDHLSELESFGMMPRGIQLRLSIFLVKRQTRWVSHVVATGEGWRQRFIERWGVSPESVTVIENGSEIVDLLVRDNLRAFSPIASSNIPTIIYVGAFEPWHGITVLVKAAADVISKGDPLKLILIGSGSCEGVIRQMVIDLNLQDQISFTGSLSSHEIADYLAKADIGVSPYCGRVEYSGLKLLDYKSAGLAVIASGEGDQPTVLKHGSTGWIVPPCDEIALSDAIVQLSKKVDLRREIGRRARIEAESHHSWMYTAKQLEQLFLQLIAKSSK